MEHFIGGAACQAVIGTCMSGYDSVWDVTADFMHVNLWYPSHVIKALKGKTKIANPRYLQLQLKKPLTPAEVEQRKAHNDDLMQRHTQAKEVSSLYNLAITVISAFFRVLNPKL